MKTCKTQSLIITDIDMIAKDSEIAIMDEIDSIFNLNPDVECLYLHLQGLDYAPVILRHADTDFAEVDFGLEAAFLDDILFRLEFAEFLLDHIEKMNREFKI
jgi:hypothetical protein